ncbi:MAG: hypothetical protein IPP12_14035 [Nitrospira sp.]|nr:hypothetical protein [Nitrospira sp.]
MSKINDNTVFRNALREVDRSASAILDRGYDDVIQEWDDYGWLIQSYEFRKLVTLELYEAYFPPERHEFELHLLTQLVDAVAASKPAAFLAGAAAGGVVGNAVYDMLKAALSHIAKRFAKVRRTHDAVQEIGQDVEKILKYMDKHADVTTSEIASDLDIETQKVESVLKLLGCRSHRVKRRRLWRKPEIW